MCRLCYVHVMSCTRMYVWTYVESWLRSDRLERETLCCIGLVCSVLSTRPLHMYGTRTLPFFLELFIL